MAYQSEIDKLKRRYDEKPEQWFAALADAHRKNGEIEQALAIVRSGIKERPNYVSGHIVLGRCLVDKGSDDEAEKVFEEVLELDAENIIALKVLGDVAERRGNVEGARRWLERLLEVDPMNEEARDTLERVLATAAQPAPPAVITPPDPDVEIVRQSAPHAAAAPEAPSAVDAHDIPPEIDVDSATPMAVVEEPEVEEVAIPSLESAPPDAPEFTIERASDPFARADQPAEDLSELLETGPKVVSFDTPERSAPEPTSLPEPEEEAAPVAGLMDSSAGLDVEPAGSGIESTEPESRDDRSTEVVGLEAQDLSWLAEVAATSWPPDRKESPPPVDVADVELDVELVEGDTQPIPSSAVSDLRRSEAPEDADAVVTETMAEVFAAQGLIDQARDVYLKLLRQRPTDESIRHKLVELEQRRKAQGPVRPAAAPSERASAARTVAASATGGTSVRTLFSDLLSKRPTSGAGTGVPATSVPDPKSVVARRGAEAAKRPVEPKRQAGVAGSPPSNRGEPTRPAGDEVSLASVFGDHESAEEAPQPAPREGRSVPKAGTGTPVPAPDVGMTFDRFFGGAAEDTKSEEAPSAGEDDDEDFKAWLQGLKS